MNILIIKEEELINGKAVITGGRLTHIRETLKKDSGDTVKAGILNGMLGTAHIESIDTTEAVIRFSQEKEPPKAPDIKLILALPRPKVLRRVLYAATCLGIKQICVFNAWRVEKSYWSSPLLDGIDDYLLPALEQSKDTIMPSISFHRFFTPFIREELPEISKDTLRIAADPSGLPISCSPSQPITLVIGAEGGFIQKELDTLKETGFSFFSVGERILNVETAVPFILGRLI